MTIRRLLTASFTLFDFLTVSALSSFKPILQYYKAPVSVSTSERKHQEGELISVEQLFGGRSNYQQSNPFKHLVANSNVQQTVSSALCFWFWPIDYIVKLILAHVVANIRKRTWIISIVIPLTSEVASLSAKKINYDWKYVLKEAARKTEVDPNKFLVRLLIMTGAFKFSQQIKKPRLCSVLL